MPPLLDALLFFELLRDAVEQVFADLPFKVSATVFNAGALLHYPVALTRYDAVVALALAAFVASAFVASAFVASTASSPTSGRRRKAAASIVAWASLGFGTVVKLVPVLATLPLVLLAVRRNEARTLK